LGAQKLSALSSVTYERIRENVALSNGLMGYPVLIQELQKVPFPVAAFTKT
jgi:hypothetical protein